METGSYASSNTIVRPAILELNGAYVGALEDGATARSCQMRVIVISTPITK